MKLVGLGMLVASLAVVISLFTGRGYGNSSCDMVYRKGVPYTINKSVFVLKVLSKKDYYAVSPAQSETGFRRNYDTPLQIDDSFDSVQTESGARYNLATEIVGVLDKGTNIIVDEVIKSSEFSWFFGERSGSSVRAAVLSGPHSGIAIELDDISIAENRGASWCYTAPNPTFLIRG